MIRFNPILAGGGGMGGHIWPSLPPFLALISVKMVILTSGFF